MISEENDVLDFDGIKKGIEELLDQSELQEMLKTQLVELGMLRSMFSNPGEFEMGDPFIVDGVQAFVTGISNDLPTRLNFSVNLKIDGYKLEVCVDLPLDYPMEVPEIFVRSGLLTKHLQRALNNDLAMYVSSLTGEICVLPTIAWLQENATQYLVSSTKATRLKNKMSTKKIQCDRKFFRYWIFTFCSQSQMRVILEMAEACNVTGFCLIGRPMIMCVEGWKSECDDWWYRVRRMRITCKKKEEKIIRSDQDLESFRKFKDFKEISFDGGKRVNLQYPDIDGLHKYLAQHGCSYVLKDYLGVYLNTDTPTQ